MKKKNYLIKSILTAILLGVFSITISCKDDFSEEDFLTQQYELAEQKSAADHARDLALQAAQAQSDLANILAQGENALALAAAQAQYNTELVRLQQLIAQEEREEYLEAYRNAGLLVKGNIIVIDGVTNNVVTNATVSLFGKDATTSAQGIAIFEDIPIGAGDLEITANNYYTTSSAAIIAYVAPQVAGNGGLPIQRTITANLKMVADSSVANSSVTVTGKVTLDSNLTNAITEFPLNSRIEIDYTAALTPNADANGIEFPTYQINNPNFQPADINATTGEYTITVPAIDGIELILPQIEEEITYIESNPLYDANTNPDVDQFLIKTTMGVFDMNTFSDGSYQTNVSTSDLYEYTFDGLQGSGFDLKFTQLFDDLYRLYEPGNSVGFIAFNQGDSYKSIPTVTLTASGSDSVNDDKVWLNTNVVLEDLSFSGGNADGTSIADGNTYNIFAKYVSSNGNDQTRYIGTIETEVSATAITYKSLNIINTSISGVHAIEEYYLDGIADADQPSISQEFESVAIQNLSIVKGATAGVYTTWPNVTFAGGTPNIAASFSNDANRSSQWAVSVNNAGSNYDILPEIKYTYIYGNIFDLRNESNEDIATTNLILNTAGTISLNTSNLKTNFRRPSEMATVIEDKLPEGSGASLSLTFSDNSDIANDINSVTYNGDNRYKTKPEHRMTKKYTWVTDATVPLALDIVYFNNVAPLSATQTPGTGIGYMNPQPQTNTSNNTTISSSDQGTTITRNFLYGVGELKE